MASETMSQGFICPYCLVSFPTADKLQSHFVDFHSEGSVTDDYDVVEYGNGDADEEVSG